MFDDERYFRRLESMVAPASDRNPARSRPIQLAPLHKTPLDTSTVKLDENRVKDALDLRAQLSEETKATIIGPASVLEVLLALCQRLAIQTADLEETLDEALIETFWLYLSNADMYKFTDEILMGERGAIDEMCDSIDRVNLREYDRTGEGGLFPIGDGYGDIRTMDLWTQAQLYAASLLDLEFD